MIGMNKKGSGKNELVKVHDFRVVTIADIFHHIIPIFEKNSDYIIIHVGSNDSTFRTSHEILDAFLQHQH